jgi:hypothetical protein
VAEVVLKKETTTTLPPTKKQQVDGAGKPAQKQNVAVAKKYINYSDPPVAATMKETANHYNETGKYLTFEDAMLSEKPLLSLWIPRDTVSYAAVQQKHYTNPYCI